MEVQLTKQQETQLQAQKYTVQQDFKNVAGIAFELQAVMDHFKDQPDHPMLAIQMNRLILQLNLSNCIHYETLYDSKVEGFTKQLRDSKQLCIKILTQVRTKVQLSPEVLELLDTYIKNSLQENVIVNQLQPKKVEAKAEFNQNTVQTVINSMSSTDNQYQDIQNGKKIEDLDFQSVLNDCQKRKLRAVEKLKENWPANKDNESPIDPAADNDIGTDKDTAITIPIDQPIPTDSDQDQFVEPTNFQQGGKVNGVSVGVAAAVVVVAFAVCATVVFSRDAFNAISQFKTKFLW